MRRLILCFLLASVLSTSGCDWNKSSNSNSSPCEQSCTAQGWVCVYGECVIPCGPQAQCPAGYLCYESGAGQFCRYELLGDYDAVDHSESQCLGLEFEQYCNGLDDDCDGQVDENFNLSTNVEHCGACNSACEDLEHSSVSCVDGTCQYECMDNWYDYDPEIPGCEYACVIDQMHLDEYGRETSCDMDDDDCDGEFDEDCECSDGTARYCGSIDEDAQGECQRGQQTCEDGVWSDCDEILPTDETCDNLDNDCDGMIDEDFEIGYPCQGTFGTCNSSVGKWECTDNGGRICDIDPFGSQYVGRLEFCDGLDNDCDGEIDELDQNIFPGVIIGQPCPVVGACGQGVWECAENQLLWVCSTSPGSSADQSSEEICNGIDDDCDGEADEDFGVGLSCDGVGECGIGVLECEDEDSTRCSTDIGGTAYEAETEICDNLDNDCDGLTDEDFNVGDSCPQLGVCSAGEIVCVSESASTCNTYPGGPDDESSEELCDGLDNDCDGEIDEDFRIGDTCEGVGQCGLGTIECASETETRCSTDQNGSSYEGLSETCDGLDNDCDGEIDEDFNVGNHCDGVGECSDGVWECNDFGGARCSTNPEGSSYSASSELCDGLDNDCDGSIDEIFNIGVSCIGEGSCGTGQIECDSSISTRCSTDSGGSQDQSENELCNGFDDDCDGEIDEDYRVGDACEGVGQCGVGFLECADAESARCSSDIGGSSYDGTQELCDGVDNDCDDVVDEDFNVGIACAGIGQCSDGVWECDGVNGSRCSTSPRGSSYDGQSETCDGLDNDCDGQIDEDYFVGNICDGVGVCGQGVIECENLDDTRCSTDPGGSSQQVGIESCNGLDDDCDGEIDEDFLIGDPCNGRGECGNGVYECADAQTIRCSSDVGASEYDGTQELCDSLDNDCDGAIDEDYAIGQPCWGVGVCSDIEGMIECASQTERQCSVLPDGSDYFPSSIELCGEGLGDGLDNDCDGLLDEDCNCQNDMILPCGTDEGICELGEIRCVNNQWTECIGAYNGLEQELCNGLDDDCDGIVPENEADYDEDGYRVCDGDCRDLAPWANPGAVEKCDYADDDCDGQIDEGFHVGAPCTGKGVCEDGLIECAPSNLTVCTTMPGGSSYSQPDEVNMCDGLDNDCDGQVDEGCECNPNGVIDPDSCGPIAQDGIGICLAGSRLCVGNHWGDCFDAVEPLDSELCNGEDDDCDGLTDEDFNLEIDPDNCGGCGDVCSGINATASCVNSQCSYSCDSGWHNIDPETEGCEYNCWQTRGGNELCDELDNDCDGFVDEDTNFEDDVLNCGACGNNCGNLPQVSQTLCVDGQCQIDACIPGYQDQGTASDGCETYVEDLHEVYCCYSGLNPTDYGQLGWGSSSGGWASDWNNPLDQDGCFTVIVNAQGIQGRTVFVGASQAQAPGPPDPQWYDCTAISIPVCTVDGVSVTVEACVEGGRPVQID